jgi:hypothetical protein
MALRGQLKHWHAQGPVTSARLLYCSYYNIALYSKTLQYIALILVTQQ